MEAIIAILIVITIISAIYDFLSGGFEIIARIIEIVNDHFYAIFSFLIFLIAFVLILNYYKLQIKGWFIKKKYSNLKEKKSGSNLDGMNIDNFAELAASFYDNPAKYQDFLTGWWYRLGVERTDKAVNSLNSLMVDLRTLSSNSSELKQQIIQSRVVDGYAEVIAMSKLQRSMEIDAATDEKTLKQLKYEITMLEQQIRMNDLRLDEESAKNRKINIETDLLECRKLLFNKINSEFKFNNLDMKQVFVLIEMVKDYRPTSDIFNAEAEYDKLKAEAFKIEQDAEYRKQEARGKKAEAMQAEYVKKATKKEVDENYH